MRFSKIFPIAIVLIMLLTGVFLYPYLPATIATHWGIDGSANGYSSKLFGLFFMPILCLFLYFIFLFLPKTDAYRRKFPEFDQYYYLFLVIIFAFLFYLHLLTIFWNLGSRFNMFQAMSPGLALIFFYAGHLAKISHRNWFVGIRTPWTLTNDEVWQKTNTLGGNFLQLIGAITLISTFLPQIAFYLVILPVLVMVPVVMIYSYQLSRSLKH